jgi:hypothetical protein
MTTTYLTTNLISSATTPTFTFGADFDTLGIAPNVSLASLNWYGVTGTVSYVSVFNNGQIFADLTGIELTHGGGGTVYITNGPTGSIYGGSGAIFVTSDTHYIDNYGSISTTGDSSFAIHTQGPGEIRNYGTISGGYFDNFGAPSNIVLFYNAGTLSGLDYNGPGATMAFDGNGGSSIERLVNVGKINGSVILDSGAGSSVYNGGSIVGNVTIGAGTGQIVNSTYGTIVGTITTSSNGGTVIAGQTGGLVVGGSGNDIFYANSTQAAADNAAVTTLDGGTGRNALYGSGAFNTFLAGSGGINQIWGHASQMDAVTGYENNTLSFANDTNHGVYVDLLNGHNAYVSTDTNWAGSGTFEDWIVNVPNVIGSTRGDLIQCDNGKDRITGSVGADSLYAGTGQDTFIYNAYGDSNLTSGYDTIAKFKIGTDKIDISAFMSGNGLGPGSLVISTAGASNTVYIERTPGTFNAMTDLAMIVNTTTTGGLHATDFVM